MNKNNYAITRLDDSRSEDSKHSLKERIRKLDIQIAEINQIIFQAQIVRIRSMLSGKRNFIEGFQKRIVESSASNSVSWHQKRLFEFTRERNLLQDQLDRLNGKFWTKQLLRLIRLITIWFIFISIAIVFCLGIIAAFYLLPIVLIFGVSYWLIFNLRR